jgi:hypothetical protein
LDLKFKFFFARQGCAIHGVDNNQRAAFFGPQGDTRWNQKRLADLIPGFTHHELDIRDRQGVLDLVAQINTSLCAGLKIAVDLLPAETRSI